jgi:hypothetical protein
MSEKAERFRVRGAEFDSWERAALKAAALSSASAASAVSVEMWREGRWQHYCAVEAGGFPWEMLAAELKSEAFAV